MKTFKQFISEDNLDEGWKDYLPSADSVYAFGRNVADTATGGAAKYGRAAIDYTAKNALYGLGMRKKGTTYDKELKQEKEKLQRDNIKNSEAAAAGDLVGMGLSVFGPGLPLIGGAISGANKASDVASKSSQAYKYAKTIFGLK
jgi:hypothetical protein